MSLTTCKRVKMGEPPCYEEVPDKPAIWCRVCKRRPVPEFLARTLEWYRDDNYPDGSCYRSYDGAWTIVNFEPGLHDGQPKWKLRRMQEVGAKSTLQAAKELAQRTLDVELRQTVRQAKGDLEALPP